MSKSERFRMEQRSVRVIVESSKMPPHLEDRTFRFEVDTEKEERAYLKGRVIACNDFLRKLAFKTVSRMKLSEGKISMEDFLARGYADSEDKWFKKELLHRSQEIAKSCLARDVSLEDAQKAVEEFEQLTASVKSGEQKVDIYTSVGRYHMYCVFLKPESNKV